MINLFAIPANDQSIWYLGQIFGKVGGVLGDTTGSQLLGTMFKTFNTVMLVLGAFLIVYTTIVGVLRTAQEGEFMGKKWGGNSIWIVLRTLLGIAALFPTATGYSALQVIVMWIVMQGVGAADMIWGTALNYIQVMGSPYASVTVPSVDVANKTKTLFQSLVCQATAKVSDNVSFSQRPLYYCAANPGDPICAKSTEQLLNVSAGTTLASDKSYVYKMGPKGNCGELKYCNMRTLCTASTNPRDQIKCEACKAQMAALNQIVPVLGKLAEQFVNYDREYINFSLQSSPRDVPDWIKSYCVKNEISSGNCCVIRNQIMGISLPCDAPMPKWSGTQSEGGILNPSIDAVKNLYWASAMEPYLQDTSYIESSMNYYVGSITNAITTFMASIPQESQEQWIRDAHDYGWLIAGSYYNKIASLNNENADAARPTFEVTAAETKPNEGMTNYRNNLQAAATLNSAAEKTPALAGLASIPDLKEVGTDLNFAASGVMNDWIASMSTGSGENKNPLAQLQSFGKKLLITAEAVFAAFLLATAVIAASIGVNALALGTGVINYDRGFWMAIIIILPVFFGVLGILFTFGGLLAVYTPLIPYIIFTMTALGWLIYVIEAMIAAPLVAFGILSPGGQHEIMGRSEPALMLLLGVFLRPSLMIFGMMAAMLLASVIVIFVNKTFLAAMSGITHHPAITETILFMAAYTFLIISVLNKCFSLIHLIPERVMTWIGGQAIQYGEGEGLREVKQGTEAAGGRVAGAAAATRAAGTQVAGAPSKNLKDAGQAQVGGGGGGGEVKKGGV